MLVPALLSHMLVKPCELTRETQISLWYSSLSSLVNSTLITLTLNWCCTYFLWQRMLVLNLFKPRAVISYSTEASRNFQFSGWDLKRYSCVSTSSTQPYCETIYLHNSFLVNSIPFASRMAQARWNHWQLCTVLVEKEMYLVIYCSQCKAETESNTMDAKKQLQLFISWWPGMFLCTVHRARGNGRHISYQGPKTLQNYYSVTRTV